MIEDGVVGCIVSLLVLFCKMFIINYVWMILIIKIN